MDVPQEAFGVTPHRAGERDCPATPDGRFRPLKRRFLPERRSGARMTGHPLRSLHAPSAARMGRPPPNPLPEVGGLEWRFDGCDVAVVFGGWVVGDFGGAAGVGYVGGYWF